jgi:hypothetical protein
MTTQPPAPPTGPPPTGPPTWSGPPPGGGGSGVNISWKALVGALLVVIVALGAVVGVLALSGDDDGNEDTSEFELEPISSTGQNPFMPAVGIDQANVTPPAQTGGTFEGNTPGLYGGTRNVAQCDAQQMVTYLQQNPDLGSAWASVIGISVSQIPTYVAELTPVVLRSDTYVTNHGFENGRATPIPAVLQAGTAVLVDKYGTPVTKCYCGNPLRPPPRYGKTRYAGPRWGAFEPSGITIIQKTTVIIDIFVLVDPVTGETIMRPRGPGANDQPSTPPPAPAPPPPPPAPEPEPEPEGPSPEERAIAKVQEAATACYPFPAPIEDSNDPPNISTSPGDSTYFVLTASGTTVSGNYQEFVWHVDRATLAFTPQNDFAQVASDHCPGLR